jgi:hypothetical protein
MLKKITLILLVIFLVSGIDFVLSFIIDFLFQKNAYLNKSFIIYLNEFWFTTALISILAVGVTSLVYLFFYFIFINSKYSNFYKKWGGLIVLFIVIICFMGSFIFAFATSAFAIANLLRICASAWFVTFLITKIIEKPSNAAVDN